MGNKLRKRQIIKLCKDNQKKFYNTVKDIRYQVKSVHPSEMLMFVSVTKYLNIKRIIESGRARGQSTKIIAKSFKNKEYEIISIEIDKYKKDSIIAMQRLKYHNLKLLYGDFQKIIFNFIRKPCVVLIDGPKKERALKLALRLIKEKNVKAIFIHDIHKDLPFRKEAEDIFRDIFFSDDSDYVKEFSYLDKEAWENKKKRGWYPYMRNGKKMKSYSSTLGVIFNTKNSVNKRKEKKFLESLKNKSLPNNSFFNSRRFYKISKKLIYFIPFYVFQFKFLLKKWKKKLGNL